MNPPSRAPEPPANILLVDDREDGLLTLEAILKPEGYRLTRARSGMEAVAKLYGLEFAAVLLDVQMPDLNGFETAKLIRSNPSSREVPILFITAISKDASHVYEGYEAGAVDYLFKPFDPHTLKCKVRIFAELYRKGLKIKEQTRLLVETEQQRCLELSLINQQLKAEIRERTRAQKETLEISERVQKRIGWDLHDGVAQQLTAMSFLCRTLMQRLQNRMPEEESLARQILELNREIIQETKAMAHILYPVELERLGLPGALQELAAMTSCVFSVNCRLRWDEPFSIQGEEVSSHLYRIAQEAVHNAARHSGAKNIRIDMESEEGFATLSVSDDGFGFPKESHPGAGMGMKIMEYRAKMIGGTLRVEPDLSGGTRVVCRFPLPSNADSPAIDASSPTAAATKTA